jgi:hypothetical protein
MSNGDIVVNLLLSPLELNFLQVAIDNEILAQRGAIIDSINQSDPAVVEEATDSIDRLRAGLGLKLTLEVYNP